MKVKLTQRRIAVEAIELDDDLVNKIRVSFLSDLPLTIWGKKFMVEGFQLVDNPQSMHLDTTLEIDLTEIV